MSVAVPFESRPLAARRPAGAPHAGASDRSRGFVYFPAARGVVRRWLLGLWLVGWALLPLRAEIVSSEYQLKAAFLFNFTKFIEWPAEVLPHDATPIVIGVFRRDSFGQDLRNVVRGRKVNQHPLEVRVINAAEELAGVHLLFVPAEEESALPAAIHDLPIVTVGESVDFPGTITFIPAAGKIRFAINLKPAAAGHLVISSQLLKLAVAVRRAP